MNMPGGRSRGKQLGSRLARWMRSIAGVDAGIEASTMAQRAPREYAYERLLADIQRFQPLTREREMELALEAAKGDRAATDALVCANLRYVVKLANQYRGYGLRPADLVEEGILGLLEAARRFDPGRNLRFWT